MFADEGAAVRRVDLGESRTPSHQGAATPESACHPQGDPSTERYSPLAEARFRGLDEVFREFAEKHEIAQARHMRQESHDH